MSSVSLWEASERGDMFFLGETSLFGEFGCRSHEVCRKIFIHSSLASRWTHACLEGHSVSKKPPHDEAS